ncbi:hypothetical protein E2C01_099343 [Portunus trituberculatus]|uniref:Uncharacterized protein n=1 Tax=Portunus trituberculatus TaxID=210409 RepID=A0A5B7KGM4_PORTR|nr:hypothetical protein [Portunus trituberculatus]
MHALLHSAPTTNTTTTTTTPSSVRCSCSPPPHFSLHNVTMSNTFLICVRGCLGKK